MVTQLESERTVNPRAGELLCPVCRRLCQMPFLEFPPQPPRTRQLPAAAAEESDQAQAVLTVENRLSRAFDGFSLTMLEKLLSHPEPKSLVGAEEYVCGQFAGIWSCLEVVT